MSLSWNEIRSRSLDFAREWADASSESADAKSFWDAFFYVFGVNRRRVAAFEHYVKARGGDPGFVDLLWPGVLIAEHKSRGKNLDRAYDQALNYFPGLKDEELPRYVIVSDFAQFRVHDLETGDDVEFALEDLHANIQRLGFLAGYEQRIFREQDPVNAKAAEKLARLHDALLEAGYTGHKLEVYLVRILFCLFAEDTGIFMPREAFFEYIEGCTREDGSDLGARLNELFDVLDTPEDQRLKSRDERLLAFPHVNGELFQETMRTPAFDGKMRQLLLDCCNLDWGQISPAIFGSLFQGIMNAELRRSLGAHYTSEKNILKVIGPLFLDDLRAEFDRLKARRGSDRASKLRAFHAKLANLQFFDPACGCGNFLVITYREIRQLELEVIQELYARSNQQLSLDAVDQYVKVDVDQYHGIEIEEWPAQIARVAMWLMDHQMNVKVSQAFGNALVRIPLVKSANVVHGNALRMDWNEVVPAQKCSYVFGNPPFVGHQWRSPDQMEDMRSIWGSSGRFGRLDYVACWHRKALTYIEGNPRAQIAFVSTNSLCQGEQVGILWPWMLEQGCVIQFAHRPFKWRNEASGVAGVHCVIVGFGLQEPAAKRLFEYATVAGQAQEIVASNINPYLADGPNVILPSRTKTPPGMPQLIKGSQPTDGGGLILSNDEREELVAAHPEAAQLLRRYLGGEELINGGGRWCLWLKDASPNQFRSIRPIMERLEVVRSVREKSPTKSVRECADSPHLFTQDRQPKTDYIAVPEVSSESRRYIPIGLLGQDVVASNKLQIIATDDLCIFGVLCSTMHNAWMRIVGGRLKSDYSYSPAIYNNFPWPDPTDRQRAAIEAAARGVLDARSHHPNSSLADLYDPLSMPVDLLKAHQALDKAVDAAYGVRSASARWKTEAERVGYLFERYMELTEAQ